MLYSIIPPLIVLLSIIGIVLFLAKKVPDINRLEKKEKLNESGNQIVSSEVKSKFFSKISQLFLVILEKTIRRVRLLFLKLENTFKFL